MTKETLIKLSGEVGGSDFNCRMVTDALDGAGPVHVVIDSGGGCSITSFGIYCELIEHLGQVTTEIIRAGSAAVLPALAGQHRTIHGDGSISLHCCWSASIGTAKTLIESASIMAGWDTAVADLYAQRTGLPLKQVVKLMEAETTLCSKQALKLGFVDQILGEPQPLPEAYSTFNQQQTELGCLQFEESSRTSAMRNQCDRAVPVARRQPGAAAALDATMKHKPKLPPGREIETLERFVENQRREASIRDGLAGRLRRVVTQGGHISWPLRCTWTCSVCGEINHGPPGKNRLATFCRTCGKTSTEETP